MQQEYLYVFGDKKLVMGLQWRPVVGQVSVQQARLLAKQQQAKHWVIAGHGFFAVGLSNRRLAIKKNSYAGAVCYALLYPKGWHASIYKINHDLYWLVAVHEGTPMSSGDKLFTSAVQAQAELEQLKKLYVEIQHTTEPIAISDFSALVATHALQKAQLHTRRTLPWGLMLLGVFALSLLTWQQFDPTPVEAAVMTPDIDPYLQYWQQEKMIPNGVDALEQLTLSWEQTPLQLNGWQLKEIECDAAAQHWLCVYQYIAITDTATTVDLDSALPEGWHIQKLEMQQARLQAQIPFFPSPSHWRSAEQVRLQLLSKLQPIRPAFSVLRLAEPINLLPHIAANRSYSPIFSQSLYFEGPLRSLALLIDIDEALHWQRASLLHKPQAQATLKSSALQVTLQGVVYVRD